MAKIFLNPGHDLNEDPGAVNKTTGLTEAFVVADIGSKTKKILEKEGHEIYILQNDYLTGLVNEANAWGADTFVSIHCNGFTNPQANGTETLYYPGSKEGRLLADCIQKRMIDAFGTTDRGSKERLNLYVLNHTAMPAALAETAFITNPENEKLLASEENRQIWARAIAKGIIDYEKTKGVY